MALVASALALSFFSALHTGVRTLIVLPRTRSDVLPLKTSSDSFGPMRSSNGSFEVFLRNSP